AATSTVFPYTTLFRSKATAGRAARDRARVALWNCDSIDSSPVENLWPLPLQGGRLLTSPLIEGIDEVAQFTFFNSATQTCHQARSEEHTSELQSRENL